MDYRNKTLLEVNYQSEFTPKSKLPMKRFMQLLVLAAVASAAVVACKDDDDGPSIKPKETGRLKLSLSAITISQSPSGGRTKDVSTDDFIVTIYSVEGDGLIEQFNPWSSAPEFIELETGEYYVEAVNLTSPEVAAFDQPWYRGVSDPFTIDKEELKEVTVDCTMANYKVSFDYSANVVDNFTDWSATASREGGGESLTWVKDDNREGYFLTGADLNVSVHLSRISEFGGDEITRDFYATI